MRLTGPDHLESPQRVPHHIDRDGEDITVIPLPVTMTTPMLVSARIRPSTLVSTQATSLIPIPTRTLTLNTRTNDLRPSLILSACVYFPYAISNNS